MSKQLEFDWGPCVSASAADYFKRAFAYEEPRRVQMPSEGDYETYGQPHNEAEALVDQKRDNKSKPRMHYALAQSNPHVVMSLLGVFNYSTELYGLLGAACDFMTGGAADEFVRDVCDVVEEITGKCGAELYQSVAEFGEKKYDRGNFLLGAPICQYLDSWLRHFKAHAEGVETDPESGCLHLAHLVWNTVEAARWVGHATRDDRLVMK